MFETILAKVQNAKRKVEGQIINLQYKKFNQNKQLDF